ncbi:MAG TPA: MarR family transcriptional regulator [Pseudonocardiaceae bacterium]|nr:MarR family transcriptional regulator [Pseudonocardiaceae bacterium]
MAGADLDDRDEGEVLAARVWRALYDFCRTEYGRHLDSGRELGLTPGDLKALMLLEPGQPQAMRALADRWSSDASTVTWLIGRLEEHGLAERRAHATDRRVRVVVLTEQGEQVRRTLLDQLYRPPAAFAKLSRSELRALSKLVLGD